MRAALAAMLAASSLWGCSEGTGRAGSASSPPASARPLSAAAVERGSVLFFHHCAACHGPLGDGNGVRRAHLADTPTDLTRLPAARRDPARLFHLLRDGVPYTDMPSWRALSDDQRWDLVAYLEALAAPTETAR